MASPVPPDPDPVPAVTPHPPERRRSGRPVVLPAGCCCCCCCCLHTLGGLIGGVAGSVSAQEAIPKRMTDPNSPFPFRRDEFETEGPILPATLLYWLLVPIVAFLGAGLFALTNGPNLADGLLGGAFVMIMVLPAVQLGASVLAVLLILLFYSEKTLPLRRIGSITLWAFVGSLIGMVAMGGCLGGLYGIR
jgi:hypothetical protein